MVSKIFFLEQFKEPFQTGNSTLIGLYLTEGSVCLNTERGECFEFKEGDCQWFRVNKPCSFNVRSNSGNLFKGVLILSNNSPLTHLNLDANFSLYLSGSQSAITANDSQLSFQPLNRVSPIRIAEDQRELIARLVDPQVPEPLCTVYREIKVSELLLLFLTHSLQKTHSLQSTPVRPNFNSNSQSQELRATPSVGQETIHLREDEIQRIHRVREIIDQNLGDSFTLLGLAHDVGTNDATLKKHFKLIYGTTVFSYLRQRRMEEAKRLLEIERLSVAEVAQRLGFKHLSHFSAAFRQFYGIAPSKMHE
jgi:AraC-like DNA-binding protein